MMRSFKAWTVVMILAAPAALLADRDDRVERQDRQDRRQERAERRERIRREMELRRTVLIADELGLNESQAVAISGILKQGDERKLALKKQLKESMRELAEMSRNAPTMKDVDQRIARIQDLRQQMLRAEHESLQEASKGLRPDQKAKLAVVLGMHERQMRGLIFREAGKRGKRGEKADDDLEP